MHVPEMFSDHRMIDASDPLSNWNLQLWSCKVARWKAETLVDEYTISDVFNFAEEIQHLKLG